MAGLTRRRVTRSSSSSSHPRPRQERRNTIAQVQEPRHASHTVTHGLGCPGLVIPLMTADGPRSESDLHRTDLAIDSCQHTGKASSRPVTPATMARLIMYLLAAIH